VLLVLALVFLYQWCIRTLSCILWQPVVTAWHRFNTSSARWPTLQWPTWEDQPISCTAGEI